MSDAPIALAGIHKRFGGVHALRGAELRLAAGGTVHALMGENGSGKSTLLRTLSGQIRPDAGHVVIDGEPVTLRSPIDALRRGIAMVSQETAVAPDLSVAENVLMGSGPRRGRRMARGRLGIDWRASRAAARAVLERLELDLPLSLPVRRLAPDQRQMVEIARALSMDARVLILDEPTSSLTDREVAALFGAIEAVKRQGLAVLFVSHRLAEVFEIAGELTVLRDGATVAAGPAADFDADSLVEAMVGGARELERRARPPRPAREPEPPALEIDGLAVPGARDGVSLTVGRGEIVGVAGLLGAGRSELLEAAFGVRATSAGRMRLAGEEFAPRTPRAAIERGVGLVPPDRKSQGLVLGMSVLENLTMVATAGRPRMATPRRRRDAEQARALSGRVRLRAAAPSAPVGSLSGGNQQKVAVAKWLCSPGLRLLLLDEPTRGVDVVAKRELHELLREASAEGLGVLVSSSEYDELLELCDRVVVLFRGRVAGDLAAERASESRLAAMAGGHA